VKDISQAVRVICYELGVDPSDVAYLAITPRRARVRLFEKNEAGSKFVHLEEGHPQYGYAATRTESFEVRA
jgi:hypothetical protein